MLKKEQLLLLAISLLLFTGIGLNAQSDFANYGNAGSYEITKESNVGPFLGYDVYRPKKLGEKGELHPVITWGNGTGTTNEFYDSFLKHLASYGFIVVASHSLNVGSGSQMINGISWLLNENDRSSSKYYDKINPGRIGATGHSQGGAGSINTAYKDSRVTCIAPLAPATFTYPFFYSTAGIECPIFIMIGANDKLAIPNFVYSKSYTSATTTAIYGELKGEGHADIIGNIGNFRRYVTAWFVANLWKDNSAEQLFFTENSPIYSDDSFSKIESKYLDKYDMGGESKEDDNDNEEKENIASIAEIVASYASSNSILGALNDGFEPTSSMDNSYGVYSNYNADNVVWFMYYRNWNYEYVEYSWDSEYEISSTDIYWYNGYNGSNYSVPTDAYLSYWNGSDWIKGPYVSTLADQMNTLDLNITTNKLRLYMYNNSSPTGVIEWRVNGALKTGTKSSFTSIEEQPELNSRIVYNYPNPFCDRTMIKYILSESNYTKLDVYDLMGKHIKSLVNNYQKPGNYTVDFNAHNLSQGIYFYVLEFGADRQVGRMVVKK